MFRFGRTNLSKLIIVESPNKVQKLTQLCSQHFSKTGIGFGDEELEAISSPRETITVMPTVGHFMSLDDIKYTSGTPDKEHPDRKNYKIDAHWVVGRPNDNKFNKKGGSKFSSSSPADKIVDFVKSEGTDLTEIIVASDPDREGELIGSHIVDYIKAKVGGGKKGKAKSSSKTTKTTKKTSKKKAAVKKEEGEGGLRFSRAYIHAITPDGLEEALSQRRLDFIDTNLVDAAQARHTMDRTFGFLGSNVSRAVNAGLRSVGRVQTPSCILVHEREEEIRRIVDNFVPTFQLKANVAVGGCVWQQVLLERTNDEEGTQFLGIDDARNALDALKLGSATISVLEAPKTRKQKKQPPVPLMMQTMITACNSRFGMSSQSTASALQELFSKGWITYPRTDSTRIDPEFLGKIREQVVKMHGERYLAPVESATKPKKSKSKKDKEGNVEDAHEAIRPTSVKSQEHLVPDELKRVYRLIYYTTLASQMIPRVTESVSARIGFNDSTEAQWECRINGSRVIEPGFSVMMDNLKASSTNTEEDEDGDSSTAEFDVVSKLKTGKQKKGEIEFSGEGPVETKATPPRHLTEGTLITELKKHGVGRPSTYPSIVRTLETRNYIFPASGSGSKSLRCTPNGQLLCRMAAEVFPSVVDIGFTRKFEESLDLVAQGKLDKDVMLNAFDHSFFEMVSEAAKKSKANLGLTEEEANKMVPKYNDPRHYGSFQQCQSDINKYLKTYMSRTPNNR